MVREATVEAGSTTDVNLVMQVGASTESLTVEGTSPQIHYESHEVDGMITRPQIEGLPVNGRNFLEFIQARAWCAATDPRRATIEPWCPCWAPRWARTDAQRALPWTVAASWRSEMADPPWASRRKWSRNFRSPR